METGGGLLVVGLCLVSAETQEPMRTLLPLWKGPPKVY